MTQVSGKIYQMWDKPVNPTERRFPVTVMEAVLGLNTYLQNQFGALADIYMPIEGITETKQGQEFVFRQSPATIKAKSVTLDRIKGKTLAWNQLVGSLFLNSGTYSDLAVTKNDDLSYTISGTTSTLFDQEIVDSLNIIGGHKYLVNVGLPNVEINFSQATTSTTDASGCAINVPLSNETRLYLTISAGVTINKRIYPQVFDLTFLYGSEIDGMTNAQILAKFEADYLGHHDYDAGSLISNDAEALETVGFNQWDEQWEVGTINLNTGAPEGASSYFRTKNYIRIPIGQVLYVYSAENNNIFLFYYDSNYNYLGYLSAYNGIFTPPNNTAYIKFVNVSTNTYNHDICINISNASKNGTYEPYKKTVLPLNLDGLRVKSPNIWDEEWENGVINQDTGTLSDNSSRFRSKNFIPCQPGTTYYVTSVLNIIISGWDANHEYLGVLASVTTGGSFTTPANCCYLKFYTGQDQSTYQNNICINLSNLGHNGKYYPHGSFNPFPDGLRSAGTVYDEIVGTKVIRRVDSVDLGTLNWQFDVFGPRFYVTDLSSVVKIKYPTDPNVAFNGVCVRLVIKNWSHTLLHYFNYAIAINDDGSTLIAKDTDYDYTDGATFKTAMSGVMLYYEQANYEEFELETPIILTTEAGTTEERISPNADGLSAPFCADMTYDANANNYSANAQYAMYAVRLLNTHKLWGQDFDGTQDVTGALTGVTSINSLLYLGSSNVGIGQSNPQYKLDVSGTLHATGAATFGSTIHADGGIDSNSYITAGAVNSSSDARLKDGIIPVFNAMETIMALKPSEWVWNDKHFQYGEKCAGLIAQDVQEVIPFAVVKNDKFLALNYNVFHAYEIGALQNHEARIKALERENAELRKRLGE